MPCVIPRDKKHCFGDQSTNEAGTQATRKVCGQVNESLEWQADDLPLRTNFILSQRQATKR